MLGPCWDRVRAAAPLIHCITNYVTVNDVANVLLACGASPVMADDPEEAEEVTALAAGLCINIGTLHRHTIPAMFAAGERANALGHPVVLDPVGAGSSALRTHTALELIRTLRPAVIRCNMSEMKALTGRLGEARGVDAAPADVVTEESLEGAVSFVKGAARRLGTVAAVTGAIDLVSNGETCFVIRNGRPEMGRITGTGCQLSALTTACAAANLEQPLEAAAAAVAAMWVAGELGWANMAPADGNAAYRTRVIDAVYHLDGEALERGAHYELR